MAYKIEKRKDSYRVRKMINGKNISVSFDHYPTDKEIILAMNKSLAKKEAESQENMTFGDAASAYIEMKRNVLSPSTIRSYVNISTNLSTVFNCKNIYAITQVDINKEVNLLAASKSPKTVRNYHGFIVSVLGTYRPDIRIYTTMPQKRKFEPYRPSEDDVKKLLKYIRDNDPIYYYPICLSCYGLRRGEVCALDISDFHNGYVHVHKSKVLNDKREWVIKDTAKSYAGDRIIPISSVLYDAIMKQGYVYNGHPNQLLKCLQRSQEHLGIPRFQLHRLRSFFCAVVNQSADEQTAMELGGWETDNVMKEVYRYSLANKDATRRKAAVSSIDEIIESI